MKKEFNHNGISIIIEKQDSKDMNGRDLYSIWYDGTDRDNQRFSSIDQAISYAKSQTDEF